MSSCIIQILAKNITSRPEISRNASAHLDVESAIILTLYPISLKYSAIVIPVIQIHNKVYQLLDKSDKITHL